VTVSSGKKGLTTPVSAQCEYNVGASGDRLPYTPRWSARLGADYRFDLGNEWQGLAGASYQYVGTRFGDFAASTSAAPRFTLPSYEVVDLRVGVEHADWAVTLYVKNAGDSLVQTGVFPLGAVQQVAVGQPRSIGITVSKNF